MNIVLIGCGKVGRVLTEFISKENHDVTVIDINPKAIELAANRYDVIGVVGNGASLAAQTEAGVKKADIVIASTSSDEVNLMSCLLAKKIGAKHTIARVRNPEYSKQLHLLRDELGLSLAINPELDAASEIFKLICFPSALKLDSFSRGRVELAEIKIEDGNPLDEQVLSSLYKRYNVKVLVCIVERGNDVFIPRGDFILKNGDKIYISASHAELSLFLKKIGIYMHKLKTVMIVGGGTIGYYLSEQLSAAGIDVSLIEKDEKKCVELSELLPKTKIINGDGTNRSVLDEEGVKYADACVSLTGIDEENMVISMYAKKLGVDKIITKINRISFMSLLDSIGIETIISPKLISANRVISYIRAMTNTEGSSLKTLYKLVGNKVEALEFEIRDEKKITDIPLKDLTFKDGLIIACIIRGTQIIFPGGADTIQNNDSVIVITRIQGLREIKDILQ